MPHFYTCPTPAPGKNTPMQTDLHTKLDFIFGRRSIRVFKPGAVDDATVRTLLEAAMAAPSACAKDPWHFVVVRDRATLRQLADALPYGKMLADAAVGIVVCGDTEVAHDHKLSYLLQDCAAAIENLLLAVHAAGLGAVWLGVHPREDRIAKLSALLKLPGHVLPVSAIAIGQPGETKPPRTRYKEESVHHDTW